jgi:GNAT superfamily N-acetyltransferase
MIRPFENKDEVECRKIIGRCFDESVTLPSDALFFVRNRYTKKGYLEAKSKEYQFFVFEKNHMILGIGALKGNNIQKIYVNPDYQGRGIGAALLRFLEELAVKKGHKELILFAFDNSVTFYKKQGYAIVAPFTFQCEDVNVPTVEMKKVI